MTRREPPTPGAEDKAGPELGILAGIVGWSLLCPWEDSRVPSQAGFGAGMLRRPGRIGIGIGIGIWDQDLELQLLLLLLSGLNQPRSPRSLSWCPKP